MPLPHYPGNRITHIVEHIYLGEDINAKQYTWYYGVLNLTLFKNKIYNIGFSKHDYGNIPLYYKCERIEIDGNSYNIKANFEELLNRELIPISIYRQKRIDEILEN